MQFPKNPPFKAKRLNIESLHMMKKLIMQEVHLVDMNTCPSLFKQYVNSLFNVCIKLNSKKRSINSSSLGDSFKSSISAYSL